MKTPIEQITHPGSRLNIPTPELEPVMDPADKAPIKVAYARRNPDLDPQLIWRGKDPDQADFTVDAPPLYLQEQVHPKAIIEDLRNGLGRKPNGAPGPDLFDHFGVTDDDREAEVEFYRHARKWSNRMILGDGLQVMASLAAREGLKGQVQAIYIDPPYGIRFNSNFQWSTTSRDVKDGNLAHLTREPEQVKAFRDTWRDGIHSYLTYLRDRLTVARDLLTESGSCFVQIGDENVHRVRALMDEVFGEENFAAQIVVKKTTSQTADNIPGAVDYILVYAKSISLMKYRQIFWTKKMGVVGTNEYQYAIMENGEVRRLSSEEHQGKISSAESDRVFAAGALTSQRPPGSFPVVHMGRKFGPGTGFWKTGERQFPRLLRSDRVIPTKSSFKYRRYLEDFPVMSIANYWDDTSSGASSSDPKIYIVQTVTRIIERCLLMATTPATSCSTRPAAPAPPPL